MQIYYKNVDCDTTLIHCLRVYNHWYACTIECFIHPRAGGNIQMREVLLTDVEWLLIEN